ncbi:hypothetical protein BKA70DRAFT_1573269 [Coprinopsis sp. MPI-PUGE-AT-0042]|nr:hypothetical protein BKA70DRAFT_1573269 [Coprinopsis sp. MPI-PUGE-AT-0042]
MSQLEYLKLENRVGGAEELVHSVVSQLPCLVECIIALSSTPADITMFQTLAASCPNLTRLQLPINTEFPAFDPTFTTPKKHRLHHLAVSEWVGYPPDQEKLFLAVRYLNAAFPYLRVLDGSRNWKTVMNMLATVRDIAWGG